MKITQVQLENSTILSLGDNIVVEYKPVINDEESVTPVTEEITISSFKPFDDGSNDVWIISESGEVFAEENFKHKKY
jgi:hypothetical protein